MKYTKYTITPNILSYELLIILQKCNRGFETYAARSMLKLTLLFYNATPPPTNFPDLLQIFTVSLQQAYNTLYPFDLQKTSFTYSESNFHVGNLQFFTSSNQSTSNTSLLCIKNIFQLQQDFKCMFSFECR